MITEYTSYAMAVVLLVAIVIELRTGKIPNWLTLVPFLLFILVAANTQDRAALGWQMGMAAGVFAFGIVAFIFAGFGAGAVKLMTGVALFVPLENGLIALAVFVAALFISTFLIVMLRKMIGSESSQWQVLANRVLPMSLPLGVTGIVAMFVL